MAITDRLGATVSATEAPSSSTPNAGLAIKTPVRAATIGSNIALSGLQTIDGVSLNAGDRVLVKDQSNQTQNGIYNVASGVWAASSDFQSNTQVAQGLIVMVSPGGLVNGGATFQLTTATPIVLGTSNITFSSLGVLGASARRQRSITSSGNLPITTTDSILNLNIGSPLSITIPAASTRAGAPLLFQDVGGTWGGAGVPTFARTGSDTFGGLTSIAGGVNFGWIEFIPLNDGVNVGYNVIGIYK